MHTPFALTQTTPTQDRSANQPSLSSATSRPSFFALARVCALLLVLLAAFSAAVHAQAPNWVQNSPATTPSGGSGYGYSMVDDAALGQVFMFSEGATWLWNGVNWTSQSTTSSPGARLFSQMDYDSVNQQVVLFGGCEDCQGSNTVLGDTWLWTGADWVQPDRPDDDAWRALFRRNGLRSREPAIGLVRREQQDQRYSRRHLAVERYELDAGESIDQP